MPDKGIQSVHIRLLTQINSGKVILVDFYADRCDPCKLISPDFETLSDRHPNPERVEFCRVDIDGLPDNAVGFGIRAMPTFHAYKNGERIEAMVGANRAGLDSEVRLTCDGPFNEVLTETVSPGRNVEF
ncbi:thioredoxin-like protein [Boletus reticuloceps]|uniref:Thioredoxin-like protein n=1 Tax=Boletus reticuloceps TaxID=495285 RepID=A0A8I2YWE0_9AGAM|nr:thioredoxin-like protein [Boletus reticuloceps]